MKWEDYYDKFYDLSENAQIKLISLLEDLGPEDEVVDVIQSLGYDHREAADRVAKKAIGLKMTFSCDSIGYMDGSIDGGLLDRLAAQSSARFTCKDLEELYGVVSDEALVELYRARGIKLPGELSFLDEEEDSTRPAEKNVDARRIHRAPEKKRPSGGFLSRLLWLFTAGAVARKLKSDLTRGGQRAFKVGDHVRVKYRGQEGTVIDINGSYYMVSLSDGRKVDSYTADQLEKAR